MADVDLKSNVVLEGLTMKIIDVENLTTKINDKTILKQISFSLAQGKVLALVGHNGAGKTTLIKTIMGLYEKASGEITVMEKYQQSEHLLSYKKQINYLPEEPILLSEFTVMQHFQMYGMSYDIAEGVFLERVENLSKAFHIDHKLNAFPEELSKGMRQKVQTICALLPDVPLLLIDEPFIGLDIYAMDYLKKELLSRISAGLSIILTTHQLDFVRELADEFLLLDNGEVYEFGLIEDFDTISSGVKND